MPGLLRCKVCGATTERERMLGQCGTCGNSTCPQCQRICDGCLRIFCMLHIGLREVWRQGVMSRMKLCEGCVRWF